MKPSFVPEEVLRVIRQLTGGHRYASADLYGRYVKVCQEMGRSPEHPVRFGQELRNAGLMRAKVTVDGAQTGGWRL